MLDPIGGVKTDSILWWQNGVWKEMPHRHFFCNNVRTHLSAEKKRLSPSAKKQWLALYAEWLQNKKVVKVNNLLFKYFPKPEVVPQAQ